MPLVDIKSTLEIKNIDFHGKWIVDSRLKDQLTIDGGRYDNPGFSESKLPPIIPTKENPYIDLRVDDDRYVTVYYYDKPYYLDQMPVIPYYRIDRMTGECTDENGEKIDLYNPSEAQQTYFKRGFWRCDDFSGWGNDGYFWFSGNDSSAVFYDAASGNEIEFTYRFVEDHGIIYFDDSKIYFRLDDTEEGKLLSWTDDAGFLQTLRMTFIKPVEKDKVKFYSFRQLEEKALNDFIAKNGQGNYTAGTGVVRDGLICIIIRDEDTYEFLETYTLDPLDGTGHTESGEYVNFGEEKKKSVCDLIMTLLVEQLRFWLDILCGIFLN